jgi:hypothetical protein
MSSTPNEKGIPDDEIKNLPSQPESATEVPADIINSVKKLRTETLELINGITTILHMFSNRMEMNEVVRSIYAEELANLLYQFKENIYSGIFNEEVIKNDYKYNHECRKLFDDFLDGTRYQYYFKAAEELFKINNLGQMKDPITKERLKMYFD